MGQYHKLVNIDKKEFVHPHKLGLGLKQCEQTGSPGSLADVMYILLSVSNNRGGGDLNTSGETPDFKVFGRWCGDRVLIIGDYAEDSDVPGIENVSAYYDDDGQTDITDQIIPAFERAFGVRIDMTRDGWRKRQLDPDEWSWLIPDLPPLAEKKA